MTPEEIAFYDRQMKSMDPRLVLDADRLFFAMSDKKAISRLKSAAQSLVRTKELLRDDKREAWEKAFGKQVRYSVDRAKKSGQ